MALASMVLSIVLLVESATAFVQPRPPAVSSSQTTAGSMKQNMHRRRRARPTRMAVSMVADEGVGDGSDLPRVLWCVPWCFVLKKTSMKLKHDVRYLLCLGSLLFVLETSTFMYMHIYVSTGTSTC